jgi:molecular chaperone DnaK
LGFRKMLISCGLSSRFQMVDYSNIPRDSRRVPLETRVQFKFDLFSGFLSEYSSNISPGGLFIRTRTPQPMGTLLDFEFRLGDGFELIKGSGEVVWVREEDDGPTRPAGMGLRFRELSQGSQELIYRIVDQHVLQGGTPFDVTQRPPDPLPASPPPLAPPINSQPLAGPRLVPPPPPAPAASAPADPFADVFELPPLAPAAPRREPAPTPLPDVSSWAPVYDDPALDPPPLDAEPFPELLDPAPPEPAGAPPPAMFATTFGTAAVREPRRVLPWILLAAGLVLAAGVFLLRDRLMGWAGLGGKETVQTAPPVRPRRSPERPIPAPAQPAPGATPVPEPAPVAPAPPALADPGPALTQLDRITWEKTPGGTDLILWGNGAISGESYTRTRLDGNPPRELIRLSGIRRSFPQARVVVGTPEVLQVRAGYHPEAGRGELHVVLDLARPNVVVSGVEPGPHQLRIHLQRK